ncbi:KxYKxGKxW signal peptide domain-containing protein [Loigolactobacillus jiayinensis]|uniref:KxYKxGKxW signal peptide domain-containing protein n=1 Tax=Loigolactobacillus jiayinensis TaxID=2486016 RepID=A0ABW1RG18_9LACO|nr:KxYKxGKxW signal peptide domain-containing protein [Loigolactobacillus jiayinensis]
MNEQAKLRFKLYKSGKMWLVAGITIIGIGLSVALPSAKVNAATTALEQPNKVAVNSDTVAVRATSGAATNAIDNSVNSTAQTSSEAASPVQADGNSSLPTVADNTNNINVTNINATNTSAQPSSTAESTVTSYS